jgi:hypothetical protein
MCTLWTAWLRSLTHQGCKQGRKGDEQAEERRGMLQTFECLASASAGCGSGTNTMLAVYTALAGPDMVREDPRVLSCMASRPA